jgi:thiamine-phosphate pyrophosphorylase
LLGKIGEAARAGVDYIQLREKDLSTRELEALSGRALRRIHQLKAVSSGLGTHLLINSRTDVSLASGANGVHLPADDLNPMEIRRLWKQFRAGEPGTVTISVSCHSLEEVARAEASGADLAIFAPVFEKKDAPGSRPAGLDALRQACKARIPVLALGGVTLENAPACLDAGAIGIAGIRLFQENEIAQVVTRLAH